MLCGKFAKFSFMAACISSGLLHGMVAVDSKIDFQEQLRQTQEFVQERPELGTETHAAAALGFPDVLRSLLPTTGTEQKNIRGYTPLHSAVMAGKEEAVLALIVHNANLGARVTENDLTPLHFAILAGNKGVVKALLEAGAPVDAMAPIGTPLILACEQEFLNLEIIELLLDAGANVNLPDSDGLMPLDRAIFAYREYCSNSEDEINAEADQEDLIKRGNDCINGFARPLIVRSLVALLLERGARFHGYMNNPEFNEVTLWHFLVRDDKNIELLRLLLSRSREHLTVQLEGKTPLDIAMSENNSELLDF